MVGVALLSNGIFEVFFYYREHKAALIRIQHEQAEAAAAKISQFIKEIESQLGWTTQLPWSAARSRIAGSTRCGCCGRCRPSPNWRRSIPPARSACGSRGSPWTWSNSGLDLSKRIRKFTEAGRASKVYYGPVYFRRESEPYMTLALAGTRKDAGVSIAEVNLKLIWDVVSQIKVGERGHAYVVGAQGRLIAHPDISLVLRNTDMSKLTQVQAALAVQKALAEQRRWRRRLCRWRPAPRLESPSRFLQTAEHPGPGGADGVRADLRRWLDHVRRAAGAGSLCLAVCGAATAGASCCSPRSIFAVLAGMFLARRMVGPIQALRAGAERIGGGDFAQRISIKTGDELEGLANQFNDMGARLQESYADLENKVEQRTAELSESLQQQTATSEVLEVISSSAGELEPVFQTRCSRMRRGSAAPDFGTMTLYEDGGFRTVALYNAPQAYAATQLHKLIRSASARAASAPSSGPIKWSRSRTSGPSSPIIDGQSKRRCAGRPCRRAHAGRRADAQGKRIDRRHHDLPPGGQAVHRQADRTGRQLRQPGGDRDRECAAVQGVAAAHQRLSLSLDDLRTAQDRLVQTEKLASLGQLTAGIAHEIKNPLNFVNNFSALSAELIDELNDVLKPAALDDKTREEIDELTHMLKGNLEKVVQHGKRADSIVKNMLLHSREGSGEHRPADINAIVEESLNLAYHGARAEKSGFNITLKRDLDPAAGMIDLLPAGNHPGVPQPDFQRVLCRDQAQGKAATRVSSLS